MSGLKIPPIGPLCLLLFKKNIFTGGNRGNGGAARGAGLGACAEVSLKMSACAKLRSKIQIHQSSIGNQSGFSWHAGTRPSTVRLPKKTGPHVFWLLMKNILAVSEEALQTSFHVFTEARNHETQTHPPILPRPRRQLGGQGPLMLLRRRR
jgi:hypothetical protein